MLPNVMFFHTKQTISSYSFLSVRHSLCDERGGDGVFYQNWQGNHLAELDSSGVRGSAESGVHREAPGAPSYLLQQLTLRGRSCGRGRTKPCCWINFTLTTAEKHVVFLVLQRNKEKIVCTVQWKWNRSQKITQVTFLPQWMMQNKCCKTYIQILN